MHRRRETLSFCAFCAFSRLFRSGSLSPIPRTSQYTGFEAEKRLRGWASDRGMPHAKSAKSEDKALSAMQQSILPAGCGEVSQKEGTAEHAEYAEPRAWPVFFPRIPRVPRLSPGLGLCRSAFFASLRFHCPQSGSCSSAMKGRAGKTQRREERRETGRQQERISLISKFKDFRAGLTTR